MKNKELYTLLAEGEIALKSNMGIIPYHAEFAFSEQKIKESLKADTRFKLTSFTTVKEAEESEYIKASYIADVEYGDLTYSVLLDITKTDGLDLRNYGFANNVDDKSMDAATKPAYYLQSTMQFHESAIDSFHFQLKLMDAIVPEASLVIDFMSIRLLSAKWLKMTAQSKIPPSSDYLYSIHYVYDENENKETTYWLHTHGLHRCTLPELEMVNIKQGIEQMDTLLQTVIKNFLTDLRPELEEFPIAYDGLGINMCWQRWEDALKRFPESLLGGLKDREDDPEDGSPNVHASPSGILFAVEERELTSPEIYTQTLSENPIYYITKEETARMSALAIERFNLYCSIYELKGKKEEKKSFLKGLFGKKEKEAWSFLVKFGLEIDNAKAESDKEHMWFEVITIENEYITAKLINQPYWIENLKEGDVNKYPLSMLTDWIIYSPDNTYNPDTVYELF